ncbi:MAG: hypothetical protein ACTHJM_15735 [Marmoricola sp.]
MTAESIKAGIREAIEHAKAHRITATVTTLERLHREAEALGEPEPTQAGDD